MQMQRQYAYAALRVALVLALNVCFVSSAFCAIGVYPRSKPGLVPAAVSYVLNKDADLPAGESPDWSLKIEIVPTGGGAAVKTWRFLPTDAEAKKGTHTAAVTWDGTKDDGSPAPVGYYYAKITARATPVANDTNVHYLWEDNKGNYYMPGVNNNINSPLYGRIYVAQKTNGLVVYEPDGTYLGTFASGMSWGTGSGPFGSCVDQSDNIWMSARSGTQARTAWCIKSDLSSALCGPISYSMYDRGANVYGPTSDIKLLVSACTTTSTPGNGQLAWGSGNGTLGGTPFTTTTWTDPESKWFQPAKLYYDAGAGKVRALVPYRLKANVAGTGGVVCYDIDWTGTSDPVEIWQNNATYPLALSCDISPDGYLWVTRNAATGIVRVPLADAATGNGAQSLGLAGAGMSNIFQLKLDGYGNLIGTGPFTEAFVSRVGFYEPPESTAASVATINVPSPNGAGIRWDGDASPVFVSGSFSNSEPCEGQSTTLTVTVSDSANSCGTSNDIGSVEVTCPAFGWVNRSMSYVSCSGNERTYSITGTVQPGTPSGASSVSVVINDATPGVTPGTGSVSFTIVGGYITGLVTNGETGTPAANVTIKATLDTKTFSGVTDATGRYTINVDPGSGYMVAPATAGPYATTTPTEYNLQPNWPTAGTGDWPKSVDVAACGTTADLNGRVWPLAATQVFYDWVGGAYMGGARTVCVMGTVIRGPSIPSVPQYGFNGYYWIADSRRSGTWIGCKIGYNEGDPLVKKGDKVVVTGAYDITYGWRTGRVSPASPTDVTILSRGNALPAPRDLSYYQNNGATACGGSAIIGNLLGGLYAIPGTVVTAADTTNLRYTVQVPNCVTDPTLRNITVDLNTPTSTGCPMPNVGDELAVIGVLDDIAIWATTGAIRPGEPTDQTGIPLVTSIGAATALGGGGVKIDLSAQPAIVTSAESVLGGQQWFYVESPDRTAGIRVNCAAFPPVPYVQPGDTVTWLKGKLQLTNGDRELALTEAASIANAGAPENVPKPVGMTNLAAGTGYPPASDRAFGARSQGLYATIWGRVTRIESVDFVLAIVWVDDGTNAQSAMVSAGPVIEPATGVKCYIGDPVSQPAELSVGDYVMISGIVGSEWVNDTPSGYRVRVLRTRPQDPVTGGAGDVFRIIDDIP